MTLNLMGKKLRMTQLFDEEGNRVVCTVIAVEPNVVTQVKTVEKEQYAAIQLGAQKKKKNVAKPLAGHFAKAGVEPRAYLAESRGEGFELGQEIGVDYFAQTTFVDVAGVSKGKGFQGVIKRHNFKGGPAAHGSGFHRTAGSTGQCSTPGRTFPGRLMAGRMGGRKTTTEGLEVVRVDAEKQIIIVKGAIPGSNGGLVSIRKSLKKEKS